MRLIDADALVKKLQGYMSDCVDVDDMTASYVFSDCITEIDGTPTIDSVKRGEWEQTGAFDDDNNVYECSVCGEPWQLNAGSPSDNNMNFCPNCGAGMRKE